MAPRISVLIPAYNEERYLPRLLDTIDAARAAYRHGPREVEVVVADNRSADRTADVAASRGCRVVSTIARSIGGVRNAAARAACGEVLAFADADLRIHPHTLNAIDRALASGRVVGGATGVALERWSSGLAVTYALMVPLVWLLRIDTGVVFCRRADFEAIGGYNERMRCAEDVVFLLALKRLGWSRGQRLTRLRPVKAVASLRKFDEHGDWHYFSLFARLLVRSGPRRDALVERYWYRPSR